MIQDCMVAVTACGGDARVPPCVGADATAPDAPKPTKAISVTQRVDVVLSVWAPRRGLRLERQGARVHQQVVVSFAW